MLQPLKFVLVTGATGFLGSAITLRLLSLGVRTRVLVRSELKADFLKRAGAEIVARDIRDSEIRIATADVDTVIHCAAAIGPSTLPHQAFQSINVEGTRNLVSSLKARNDLRRFVHISTVAVIGETDPDNPADERASCHPIDAYGQSKLHAEQVVVDECLRGFPAVILRPMWIYGSGSPITTNLFRKIALRKLHMIGPARNTMQPVAVDDAVEAILKSAVTIGIEGRIFNVAGPEILTIRSMCETIAQLMGTSLPKPVVPMSVALPLARLSESLCPIFGIKPPLTRKNLGFFLVNNSYSIERARKELAWTPEITFDRGAREVAEKMKLT